LSDTVPHMGKGVASGITYTRAYDRENRLTGVTGPNTSATFLYDAAGNRVLATVNGETTAYIGGVYEHTDTGASTSTYAGTFTLAGLHEVVVKKHVSQRAVRLSDTEGRQPWDH
jgi:YD repeat-containing protein